MQPKLLLTGVGIGWLICWYLVHIFLADFIHYKYCSIHNNPTTMSLADYDNGIKSPSHMV